MSGSDLFETGDAAGQFCFLFAFQLAGFAQAIFVAHDVLAQLRRTPPCPFDLTL